MTDRLHGADYERKDLVINDEVQTRLSELEQSHSPVQQAIGLAALVAEIAAVADPRVAAASAVAKPILRQLYNRATGHSNTPLDGDEIRSAYDTIRDLFRD